jgi:type III secretion protein J
LEHAGLKSEGTIMRTILTFAFIGLGLTGCNTMLQGGLDEREANQMMLVLAEAGIDAGKTGQGSDWSVEVGTGDHTRAWRALRAAGLPRPRHTGFLEVYKERALVPGRMEEQALYLSALQEEIAQTLESVEGVVTARVHASVKTEGRPGRTQHSVASASVLVCYRPSPEGQPPISEQAVQKLTANAVFGLAPERVAVVFTPKRAVVLPQSQAGDSSEAVGLAKLVALGVAALALIIAAFIGLRRKLTRAVTVRPARTRA